MKMKQTQIGTWSLAALVLLSGGAALADTNVGGLIGSDTTWTAAGGPYIVTSNILVANGATLTVEPGVDVRFNPGLWLQVAVGSLEARGTAANQIRFTANTAGPVTPADRWEYIKFDEDSADATYDAAGNYTGGCILEHAVVEYAGTASRAIYAYKSAPYINHCVIQNNDCRGINGYYAHGLRVDSTEVTGNTIGILLGHSDRGVLNDNTITNNQRGVWLDEADYATLVGNTISHNTTGSAAGVHSYSSYHLTFTGNNISNNVASGDGGGMYIDSGYDIVFTGNTISNNTAQLGDGLYIHNGDSVTFTGDKITDNNGVGIFVTNDCDDLVISTDPDDPTWVCGNTTYNVYNNQNFTGSFEVDGAGNVDARNVYWGTMDMAEVALTIYDYMDDTGKGIVFYDPIAVPEPATLALLGLGGVGLLLRRRRGR